MLSKSETYSAQNMSNQTKLDQNIDLSQSDASRTVIAGNDYMPLKLSKEASRFDRALSEEINETDNENSINMNLPCDDPIKVSSISNASQLLQINVVGSSGHTSIH